MSRDIIIAFMILAMVTAGCASVGENMQTTASSKSGSSFAQTITAATQPAVDSFRKLTNTEVNVPSPHWNWASAVPTGITRSQLVDATISASDLARLTPDVKQHQVALVSATSPEPSYRVVNIDGQPVRNCADLFNACATAAEQAIENWGSPVQVDFLDLAAPAGSPEIAVELEPINLLELSQKIAPDQPAMKITNDGNPWIVYREQGIRCKMMARTERNRGLLHVVVSLANCGREPQLLPVEVRAYFNEKPLRCYSAAETLEALYGKPQQSTDEIVTADYSFASTSEREEYRIPVNYKRIQADASELIQDSKLPPVPAFAAIPGQSYPGSPVLGDARALSGFLMQRQACRSGDPEHIGWLVFAGGPLHDGGMIEVAIDLGNGPEVFQFHIPAQ